MSPTFTRGRPVTATAPNGVTWTRRPDSDTTSEQFLAALGDFLTMHSVPAAWNWWRDGQTEQERDRIERIVLGWENGAPAMTEEEAQAFADEYMQTVQADMAKDRRARQRRASRRYDEEREKDRLCVLRWESDANFFARVAAKPATDEQRVVAEERAAAALTEAAGLRDRIGQDLERVIDARGFTPFERREHHLRSHLDCWRHPRLREWSTSDKPRFRALLAMPALGPQEMCSECEAPSAWHEDDISLRLFHAAPEPSSPAEALTRLLPGWWERCPTCTVYKVEHAWGGSTSLPGFTAEQYLAMLPPLLRVLFGPPPERRTKPATAPQPKSVVVIPAGRPLDEVVARLAEAQERHPQAEVRCGRDGAWEVWPAPSAN